MSSTNYERIRKIPGFNDNYGVTRDGKIYSRYKAGYLSPSVKSGYLCINLFKDGEYKTFRIHRLVADAYIPGPLGLPQVNHKDMNRQNNSVTNLEWCTGIDNMRHAGKMRREKKEAESSIRNIQQLLGVGLSVRQVVEKLNCSVSEVLGVKYRRIIRT
jgi:hypothetical protein